MQENNEKPEPPQGRFVAWFKTLQWWAIAAFLAIAAVIGAFAYNFGHKAFPRTEYTSGRISVTVYVSAPARLLLKTFINETNPRNDLIEGTVIGPKGKPDPSLLVVQCSTSSDYLREHEKQLVSETAQGPSRVQVIVKSNTQDNWKSFLDCLAPPTNTHYQLSGPPSAAIVTIAPPVLQANPPAQGAGTSPALYAEEEKGQIIRLIDGAQPPGLSCPAQPASSPSSTSQPSAAVSGQAASLTSRCYSFYLPTSAKTIETLQNINLSGYRIESMFPPGSIGRTSNIVWQGRAGLGPTLTATNLSAQSKDNQYVFLSGILAGVAISVLLAIVQGLVSFKKG